MTSRHSPSLRLARVALAAALLCPLAAPDAGEAQLPPIHHVLLTEAAASAKALAPTAAAPGTWILQLEPGAGVSAATLAEAGIEVIAYLPESAWIVRLDEAGAKRVQGLPRVLRLLPYGPELKVRPGAAAGELFLLGTPGEAQPLAARLAEVPGVHVGHVNQRAGVTYARVRAADGAAIEKLAALGEVVWIEAVLTHQLENTATVGPLQANRDSGGEPPVATPVWNRGLLGTGQVISITDSGTDRNEDWFRFYDAGNGVVDATTDAEEPPLGQPGERFPDRKIIAYWVQPGATAYDGSQICREGGFPGTYHGTHVAGTAAGDSMTPSTPRAANHDPHDGMAPNAQLMIQDIGNDETGCLAVEDFAETLVQAHRGGAHVHNNSWGAVPRDENDDFAPGYYTNDFLGDLATHTVHELLVVTSAGNAGDEFDAPQRTIGPPANGKNIIAVGATENGNDRTIAEFSSRGPAHDDRIKPDVVAPGVDILSARGDNSDAIPPPPFGGSQVFTKSGTSMASPAIAGAAALVRQYFTDGFYPTGRRRAADAMTPSGPLMKAVLLGGTSLYADAPSITSGWGRLWLDHVLHFDGDDRRLRVWDLARSHGMVTGEQHAYTVDVAPGAEFRATLAWFDPPAFSGSGRALVNDLDLEVIGPEGSYRGNRVRNGESRTGGGHDRLNPVEQVIIASPAGGTYTVRVKAHDVPGNAVAGSTRQAYGLAVGAAGCDSVPDAPGFDVRVDAAVTLDSVGPVEVYRTAGSCEAPVDDFRFIGAGEGSFTDPEVVPGERYAYRLRAANACGVSAFSRCKAAELAGDVPTLDVSGPWFSAGQGGHGWLVEQLPAAEPGGNDRIVAYWYVYSDGAPAWLIAQGELAGTTAELEALITRGADFPPDFSPEDVALEPWGAITFTFDGDDGGSVRWASDLAGFGDGELPISRIAPLAGEPEACVSGSYINGEQAGHGFVAEVFSQNGQLEVLVAWYVYRDGEQVWLLGQAPLVDRQAEIPLQAFSGAGFPPAFSSDDVDAEDWGTLLIEFGPPDAAAVSWSTDAEGYQDGSLALTRLSTLAGRACE